MAAATSNSLSLKDYLKRYESGPEDPQKSKKKKKKKKPKLSSTTATASGVLIVDEDPVWQKPVELQPSESESSEEDKPQVDEDIEVKRMKRLEAIRSRKPYHSISEDGSGWVSISQPSRLSEVKENASDLSPPRQRTRFDTPSPEREKRSPNRRDREGDLSPPRRRATQHSPEVAVHQGSPTVDLSPPRRVRRRSEQPNDLSPRRGKASENLSPRHSRRQHSPEAHGALGLRDADLSPPRRRRKSSDVDLSPPGRQHSRDDDPSPLRRRDKDSKSDLSPLRQRHSQDADLSPSRKSHKDSKSGLLPPTRRHSQDADLSPPRRSHKESKGDLWPPRRRHSHDADLSPPRRSSKGFERDLSPRPRPSQDDLSPPRRTRKENAVGKDAQVRRTGLLSAHDIREDITKKKKEELLRFAAMDPSVSGKGAEPVFRDKEGRRISKEEKLKMNEPEEKPKEKKLEWGKGLAQRREAEARAHELELERDKPFARTRDDPELDKMLKERVRWGDPMAHLVKGKHSEPALMDFGEDEKMKESGFIIPQTVPAHSWIKRGLDFPPNRYGIRPGRHWDGVDRSNGYEKESFKRQNEKRATETEAYLWSVSDM